MLKNTGSLWCLLMDGKTDGYIVEDVSYIHPSDPYYVRNPILQIQNDILETFWTFSDKEIDFVDTLWDRSEGSLKSIPSLLYSYAHTQTNLPKEQSAKIDILARKLNAYWTFFSVIIHDICHHKTALGSIPYYMQKDVLPRSIITQFDSIPSPILLSSRSQFVVNYPLLYEEIVALYIEDCVFDIDALSFTNDILCQDLSQQSFIDCSSFSQKFSQVKNDKSYKEAQKNAHTLTTWTQSKSDELYNIFSELRNPYLVKSFIGKNLLDLWDDYLNELQMFYDTYTKTLWKKEHPYFYPAASHIFLLANAINDETSWYKKLFSDTRRTVPNICLDLDDKKIVEDFVLLCSP